MTIVFPSGISGDGGAGTYVESFDEAVTTTDSTLTVLFSLTTEVDSFGMLEGNISGIRTNGTYALYSTRLRLGYRNSSGSLTLYNSGKENEFSSTGYTASVTTSGNNINVRVLGAVSNDVNWAGRFWHYTADIV